MRMQMKHISIDALIHDCWKSPSKSLIPPNHRLTFMVGFWTRNVPATMKNRRLYGPCGPLPPPTDEHTWVQQIMKGYDNDNQGNDNEVTKARKIIIPSALPSVSPAWESFESFTCNQEEEEEEEEPPLSIPHSIDHRFFVRGAPQCFRQSLFEDRETMDDEEDEC